MKILLLLLTIIFANNAFSKETNQEYLLVKQVSDNLFSQMTPEVLADKEKIKSVVTDNLSKHVDFNFISLKIIGKNFKKYSKPEIKDFINVMEPYMIGLFSQAFSFYNNQKIIISPNVKKSGRLTSVYIKVVESGKPDINLIFKLRKNKKTGENKVFDLIAEGISMVDSKKSEFAPIIRRSGLTGATDLIKTKI